MRNKLKKVLSLLLIAILIVGTIPPISIASTEPVVVDKTARIINLDSRTYEVALSIDGNPGDKPMDVVVVLDASSSMSGTKLRNMKDAASDFVRKVLPVGNTQNRVSVVSYGGTATVRSAFTSTQGNAVSSISNLNAGNSGDTSGGTNTQAGMLLASEMLSRFGRSNATQSVVFISDGVPTYYLKHSSSRDLYRVVADGVDKVKIQYNYDDGFIFSSWDWEDYNANRDYQGIGGNGTSFQSTGRDNTISLGLALKARGVKVFTIGLLDGLSNTDKTYARQTLNPSAPNNYQAGYFETSSTVTLESIYNSIKELVANVGTNAVVTDVIPAEFDLVAGTFKVNNVAVTAPTVTYDATTKTITWNKGNINDQDSILTYQLIAKPNYYGTLNTNELARLVYSPVDGSSSQMLVFPVPNVPVRPYATDDSFNVIVNKDLLETVATNDTNSLIEDSTGYTHALSYELVSAPYSGFTLNSDGSFVFNHSVVGPITFTYKSVLTLVGSGVYAGTYKSDLATVTINVLPVPQHELTVSVVGEGTVTPAEGSHLFDENSVVPLIATPAPGYEFAGWSGDITDLNANSSVTMDTDKAVTATFTAIPRYTLDVEIVGSGTVNKTPDSVDYLKDAVVALEAVPAAGYIFAGWSEDATGTNPNTSVTMNANKEVTATFTPVYTLTVNIVGNGSVTQYPIKVNYNPGDVVDLTAVVGDVDTMFEGWSGDITSTEENVSITMNGSKSVTATFAPIPPDVYSLTVTTEGSGTVSPSGGDFVEGFVIEVVATPASGWAFSGWSGDLTGDNNEETLTMDSDKAIHAIFTEIPVYYNLTTHVVGSGSINVTPSLEAYLKGSDVSFVAVPAAGWMFSGWSGDASGSNANGSLNMTKDMDITATFTPVPTYTLIVNHELSTGGEFAAPEVTTDYEEGESYSTSPKTVDPTEYTVNTPENASGVFGSSNITVTYIYTPVVPEEPVTYTLTVNYVLSTGGNYSAPIVTPGFEVEDAYSTSPAVFDPALFTVNAPENASGFFGSADINVTYIYTPVVPVVTEPPTTQPPTTQPPTTQPETQPPTNPVLPVEPEVAQGIVRVEFVDAQGNTIADPFQFSGGIGTNYITSPKSVDGYVVSESPANASGVFTEATIVVTYVYSDGTEVIDEEEVAQGEATTEVATEVETTEVVDIVLDETPLADALPQTGQLPAELFYGAGSLITVIGVYLKKRK